LLEPGQVVHRDAGQPGEFLAAQPGSAPAVTHELQRRAPEGINVAVFEPGFMPGTGLSRQHSPRLQRMGRGMERLPLPGISSPVKSGPALTSVTLDERWAHLRDGDFVVIDKERDVMPIANNPDRERRLWDATAKLLRPAMQADS